MVPLFSQVKLAHQESELVGLLKKIPLGPAELSIVQQRAEQLRDGVLRSRGHALLPIMLASFIFDALNTLSTPLSSQSFFFSLICIRCTFFEKRIGVHSLNSCMIRIAFRIKDNFYREQKVET